MLPALAILALGGLCAEAAPPPYRSGATASAGGFGFPMNPFAPMLPMNPWDFVNQFVPPMQFPEPWYNGENVCRDSRSADEPEELRGWLNDASSGAGDSSFNVQQESCRGGNDKYVCVKRVAGNEGEQTIYTKYECCPGFVRPADISRPGCVPGSAQSEDFP